MRFTLLALAGSTLGVPIQRKTFFGIGLHVSVGTPAQTYFMAPDFAGEEVRMFSGAETRPPHHAPIGHSTSLAAGSNGKLADNMTVADIEFANIPLSIERTMAVRDSYHYSDSEGRLPLGPNSPFLKSHVAAISSAQILTGRSSHPGLDLQLLEAIPEVGTGFTDHICPLVRRSTSWMVKGNLALNGVAVAPHAIEIEFDFNMMGTIEIPRESMSRLVTMLGTTTRDVWVEKTGRLLLPCDERTREFTIAPTFEMQLSAGGPLLNFEFAKDEAGAHRPVDRHPRSGNPICRTGFKINMQEAVWKVSPFSVINSTTVYLDGAHKQIVIRSAADASSLSVFAIQAAPAPRIPVYSQFSVETIDDITTIEFEAVDQDPRDVAKYSLTSARASQKPDGSLHYLFPTTTVRSFKAMSHAIPGIFQLTSQVDLAVARPDMTMTLKLRSVGPHAAGRKYTLEVIYTPMMMSIVLTPFTGQIPRRSAALDQLSAMEQMVFASMGSLGANRK